MLRLLPEAMAKPGRPGHFQAMKKSDRTGDEQKPPRPTPIREVVGKSRPSPPRRTHEAGTGASDQPAPGLRGQRERPEGPRDEGRPRADTRARARPTPVRDTVESRIPEPTALEDLPSRVLTSEGVEWIVRLSGRTSTGSVSDPGAPLLHLTFCRVRDPQLAVRETLLPGRSLDQLSEADLSDALSSARSTSGAGSDSDVAPGTRRRE